MSKQIHNDVKANDVGIYRMSLPSANDRDSGLKATLSSKSAQQLRQQIRQMVRQGNTQAAIALLDRLISRHFPRAEDYSNRGLIHFWEGQYHCALLDFNRAIALDPELPAPYNNRANYYVALGNYASAITDYDRTIDLNPFHVRARINRAITLRDIQRYDEALEGLDEALLFRQMTGEIYAERGRTYHLRGDWNCAIADYRRALAKISMPSGNTDIANSHHWQRTMTWLSELSSAA